MCTVFLSVDTRRIEVTTAKLCRVDLELTQESFMRTNAVVVEKKKHPIEKCPTKDVECYHYKRKGHYSSLCFFKKNLASLEDYIEDNSICDTSFLDVMTSQEGKNWTVVPPVNGKKVTFKLDTGAEVTAITKETYLDLG